VETIAGGVISLLVGLGLWAVLPRGVVLTREPKKYPPGVDPSRVGEWTIRNASALPVRLTKVVRSGIDTFDTDTGKIREVPLETCTGSGSDVTLSFDDETLYYWQEAADDWNGLVVPPGDTLTAYVNLNRTLTIHYRRNGMFGVFERRSVSLDGGV
jgi:hypothetical protein